MSLRRIAWHYLRETEKVMNLAALGRLKLFRYFVILTTGSYLAIGAAAAAPYKSNQIRVEYALPKNPAHQSIYDRLKQARALERIQTLLSPLRLPRPLLLKVAGCDGESNAWYDEGFVTVCYEFLADILKNAPEKTLPSGITQEDAILGPLMDVFLHETGHAVFDQLKVPVLGREEDAADLFSAYIMLQLGKEDAHRLILGSAYQYKADVVSPQVPLTKYADEHGIPAQRFFNVLCIAYGADQKLFADVVEKEYLPKQRAEGCDGEYEQVAFALKKLIGPYIDQKLAKKVLVTWMPDVNTRPKYQPRCVSESRPAAVSLDCPAEKSNH
jgi:Putative metallopeptidase